VRFYRAVFGMVVVYRSPGFIQAQTPGRRDVLVFERRPEHSGKAGGVAHFGFRVTRPAEVAKAERAIERAGGTVIDRGEFIPGEPYLFAKDPDGYIVEVWYEMPTSADPRRERSPRPAGRERRG
jgi:catechol 2,3-dioxygenase-like lactoylglutathione lyase family enzyme